MTLTRSRTLIVAVVVVIAALGIALIAGARGDGKKKDTGHEVAPVIVSGTKLVEQPASGVDPAASMVRTKIEIITITRAMPRWEGGGLRAEGRG